MNVRSELQSNVQRVCRGARQRLKAHDFVSTLRGPEMAALPRLCGPRLGQQQRARKSTRRAEILVCNPAIFPKVRSHLTNFGCFRGEWLDLSIRQMFK